MSTYDPHSDWPEEVARAMQRRAACGRTCGCEYAKGGDLCDAGESIAEQIAEERTGRSSW